MSNFVINPYRFVVAEQCQSLSDDNTSMFDGTRERVGGKCLSGSPFIGLEVSTAKFYLYWSGSGSGLVYARVYREGTTEPIHTFGSKNANTINTSPAQEHSFTGGGNYTILENDILCMVSDFGSSGAESISIRTYYAGGNTDKNFSNMRFDGSSWTQNNDASTKICLE
tara:strand:- start:63 stop:566 length:504 start_codon:yes stop_codon:yes gene_type:complete